MTIERSNNPALFFSRKEKKRILSAIQAAEHCTSGEIRIHLDHTPHKDVLAQAKTVFETIGMTRTAKRNGVLIYLCTKSRQFAILGDQGIDEKVPDHFWDSIRDTMVRHFMEDRFADGICDAVAEVGEKLKAYFPCSTTDINELPDALSYS